MNIVKARTILRNFEKTAIAYDLPKGELELLKALSCAVGLLLDRLDSLDDIEEYATQSDFPAEGKSGKLYMDLSTGRAYEWKGTGYELATDTELLAALAARGYVEVDANGVPAAVTSVSE